MKYQSNILDEYLLSSIFYKVISTEDICKPEIVKILLDIGTPQKKYHKNIILERLETTKKVLDLLNSY